MATVFMEPSTRTRLSFYYAMEKLGGKTVEFGSPKVSSTDKGESFEDTIRIIDGYGTDLIVVRHPSEGASKLAAEVADAKVINAGDGSREHPTQTLLDLYTIWRIFGKITGLKIGVLGDLRYGRTASSLAYGLSMFTDVKCHFISPHILKMKEEVLDRVKGKLNYEEHEDINSIMEDIDVLYVTRVQKERFPDSEAYEKVRNAYTINRDFLEKTQSKTIILHPLPRVDEITKDVDEMPNSRYFEQAANGMMIRAALISEVLGLEI